MKFFINFLIIFLSCFLFSNEDIQIVGVESSAENSNVKIYIVLPEKASLETGNEVDLQIRLRGYPLGNITNNERARELDNSNDGQSIHVIIDNQPYFLRTGPSLAPYDEEGNYFESMYKFKIPFSLSKGKHFIRVFPCRSYGESLKEPGNFEASYFYYKNKSEGLKQNILDPYITYNEPTGYIRLGAKKPVLLDFYVSNCELSDDGYKVVAIIDEKFERKLSKWTPYYIYGLKKGKHTLRLKLVDKNMVQVSGDFNNTIRAFYVQ